jgi:histidyl-tRNA synthetase
MSKVSASIPKGTRDFSPADTLKRSYIFDTIKSVFVKYGFQPIETPAMENISTLTGKYGDEGDKLIFKILNSGDFLSQLSGTLTDYNTSSLTREISEKALRYDLTVPFARFVVQHRNDIQLPFRRYQMQPVWRADRPQKGRYREFWQCDADVIGSKSLLNETELIFIFDEVLSLLGLKNFTIKINNRKILSGLADTLGISERLTDFLITLDKLDKIGEEGVRSELLNKNFNSSVADTAFQLTRAENLFDELRSFLINSPVGLQGIAEMEEVFALTSLKKLTATLEPDLTLARGLDYYTGAIFEVKTNEMDMGSICGGGRYDDLTGVFGMPGISGVGISFGADRIFDVLEHLELFPVSIEQSTRIIFLNFGSAELSFAVSQAEILRKSGISTEIYPDTVKIGKQFEYADKRKIPFVAMAGSNEISRNVIILKNMQTGEQKECSLDEITKIVSGNE